MITPSRIGSGSFGERCQAPMPCQDQHAAHAACYGRRKPYLKTGLALKTCHSTYYCGITTCLSFQSFIPTRICTSNTGCFNLPSKLLGCNFKKELFRLSTLFVKPNMHCNYNPPSIECHVNRLILLSPTQPFQLSDLH